MFAPQEVKNSVCRKSTRPQGPVGQVSRGLGARAPKGLGPGPPGPFPQTSQINLLVEAVGVG